MNEDLKIKVCGMKYTFNRQEVELLPVDFLGFIFYEGSKRFPGRFPEHGLCDTPKAGVAVFVNQDITEIVNIAVQQGLTYIQLHGDEDAETCRVLARQGFKIIKAFHVHDDFDFGDTRPYEHAASFFLFDTKSNVPGGSGKKFRWTVLEKYQGTTPFFLSGGITPMDAGEIKEIAHPQLYGIDINSGFEDEPGMKNLEKLRSFLSRIGKM